MGNFPLAKISRRKTSSSAPGQMAAGCESIWEPTFQCARSRPIPGTPAAARPRFTSLYGSTGEDPNFEQAPKRPLDPATNGWRLLARVDTRPVAGSAGGQYGVSLKDSSGSLGSFRYLLWDVSATEQSDAFGNTFYSEIDVRGDEQPEEITPVATAERITRTFKAADGRYQFTVDTTVAPDLTEWADEKLRPVVQEWYPRLVALLPSEGFLPRTNVTLRFRDDMGGTPASAGGGNINCNAAWFRKELKREALGSVVHEMVHVVQDYRRVRRDAVEAQRMPGWLVEGIPDYIRWYLYEPQTKGAEIAARNVARARYDAELPRDGKLPRLGNPHLRHQPGAKAQCRGPHRPIPR